MKNLVLNQTDPCPICRGKMELVTEPLSMPVGKKMVAVQHTYLKCSQCGEGFVEPSQIDALQRKAADTVRVDMGLLTPKEIRRVRNDLSLSQELLEDLLNTGRKSVIRWEKGTVCQSGAADSMLRVLKQFPGMAAYLALERGMSIPASPKIRLAWSRLLATGMVEHLSRLVDSPEVTPVEPLGDPHRDVQTAERAYARPDVPMVRIAAG